MISVEQEKGVGLIALLESVLTQSSHLGHTDMNIHLLPSHTPAKLAHVKRTTDPASQMWQDMPYEARPTLMLQQWNLPRDPTMHIITGFKKVDILITHFDLEMWQYEAKFVRNKV